jgi:large subunit ribosomal protein L40e
MKKIENNYILILFLITIKSIDTMACEISIPEEYICPVSMEIMDDPVICEDGYTYERMSIVNLRNSISPLTREPINKKNLMSNRNLANAIERFKKANGISREPEKKKLSQIKIFVKTSKTNTLELNVKVYDTINKVMRQIQDLHKYVISHRNLVLKARTDVILDDACTLIDYGICNGTLLHLSFDVIVERVSDKKLIHLFDIDEDETIESIKARIERKQSIRMNLQYLTFCNRVLKDSMVIGNCIYNDNFIILDIYDIKAKERKKLEELAKKQRDAEERERIMAMRRQKELELLAQQKVDQDKKKCPNCGTLIDYSVYKDELTKIDNDLSINESERLIQKNILIESLGLKNYCCKMRIMASIVNNKIPIFIACLQGKTICMEVQDSDTIGSIKSKIFEKEKISIVQQRLVFKGEQLYNEMRICDYDIIADSTIHLVLRQKF